MILWWFLPAPILLAYYVEAIVFYGVSCLLDVHMDGRGVLQMFFASFPQGPGCLSYVFLITCYVGTLVTVHNSTFLFLAKGPGPQGKEKWNYVQLPMYQHSIWWGIQRETARTLGERCKEHLKHPSPIHAHIQQTGHTIEWFMVYGLLDLI